MPGDEWQPVQGFFREKSRVESARARLMGLRIRIIYPLNYNVLYQAMRT